MVATVATIGILRREGTPPNVDVKRERFFELPGANKPTPLRIIYRTLSGYPSRKELGGSIETFPSPSL
jgi:hypothetical protein